MAEFDDALFVEAEIKKHHAAFVRQMVATAIISCIMLILVGLYL